MNPAVCTNLKSLLISKGFVKRHVPIFIMPVRNTSLPCLRQTLCKELTGKETEPWAIIYFKFYKSQIPVIEQPIETAALMLGTDKSRGYCLEMICADFLAGANLEN